MAIPVDFLGQELRVGDTIVYSVVSGHSVRLKLGKILSYKHDETSYPPFTLTLETNSLGRDKSYVKHLDRCVKILDAEAQV